MLFDHAVSVAKALDSLGNCLLKVNFVLCVFYRVGRLRQGLTVALAVLGLTV